MKVRDATKVMKADGWYSVATKGSHREFKHPTGYGSDYHRTSRSPSASRHIA